MAYLKIFPRSIVTMLDGEGGYVGRITYDFEQYGRMMYDDDTDVQLMCGCEPFEGWRIITTSKMQRLAGFSVFMNALNHYLFEVLQFDPVSQWNRVSLSVYEYYFKRVYFDMGTQQFKMIDKNF